MDDILKQLELSGTEKAEVLSKIHAVVQSWGLKLPDVPACPLHFGLHDFYRVGETELDINNGQICPWHHHRIKHETFFLIKGRVEFKTPEETVTLVQGDRKIVHQTLKHEFTALEDSLILESSKPDLVDDSIFDDPRINQIIFGTGTP
jgi:quercetin dioxygenase-like cupin family protein